MVYLFLLLNSLAVALVFSTIAYLSVTKWQKKISKKVAYLLQNEYLIDSFISNQDNKFLFLFIISFMMSYSFFDGIKHISFYTNEYNIYLFIVFIITLLLLLYLGFHSIIITDKRIIIKVLFNSIFMKNKEIMIEEIESVLINKTSQITLVLKDKTVHHVWISKNNEKILELFQGKKR